MRRFRPGPGRRCGPVLPLAAGLGLAFLFGSFVDSRNDLAGWGAASAFCSAWALWNVRELVRAWSSVVGVDDERIRWGDDETGASLRWDEVEALEESGPAADPVPALRRRDGGRFALPFATRELYRELRSRLNALPADVERRMGVD